MTAPIPQPANTPPEPSATTVVETEVARVPFHDLIEAQRNGTPLPTRIAPRLYDDFEAGMVAALSPPSVGSPAPGGGESGQAAGDVGLTPSPAAAAPPASQPVPPSPVAEYIAELDGRQFTAEDLRNMLRIADQAEHMAPMLETLSTGDYVMVPKSYVPQQTRVEAPTPTPIDPIESMIEEYGQSDPQAAQIMRVMHQRSATENARLAAENASLRGNVEQSQQVQQANGLNAGVAEFAQQHQLDQATVNALATRAGQTGYLEMMMQRRYQAAEQSGLPVDHAQIARETAIELMTFARNAYMPTMQPQPFVPQPAPPSAQPTATAPSPVIPATTPNPINVTEADIEARVQARLQEEMQRREQRAVHSALAGGSSGTPSLAPTPPDLSSMTPAQRKQWHENQLVNGIAQIQSNGGFSHYG